MTARINSRASDEQTATAAFAPGVGPAGLFAMETTACDDWAGWAEEEVVGKAEGAGDLEVEVEGTVG